MANQPYEIIRLRFQGQFLRDIQVRDRMLEIGRASHCDVVLHDPSVADRHMMLQHRRGKLMRIPLDSDSPGPRYIPYGFRIPLGDYDLERILPDVAGSPNRTQVTQLGDGEGTRVVQRDCVLAEEPLYVSVGRGPEVRRVRIGGAPLSVGTAVDNGLVLHDNAVSRRHCRLEPFEGGIVIRDLNSTNGTWVNGVRVERAQIGADAKVRVGRTELFFSGRHRSGNGGDNEYVVASPQMVRMMSEVRRYAALAWPVLVEGPSGSGKEGVARALHDWGPRPTGPFVEINGGALPPHLVESELFGHVCGAFTGAASDHVGVFEQAHGGTLFLDEIGELSPAVQAKLLRVLENWRIRRVGAESWTKVDVRLVCATHRDLGEDVRKGRFRQDLYYRIRRLCLQVPALRDRVADIEPLVTFFLRRAAPVLGQKRMSRSALDHLVSSPWQGNVRELRNVVESAAASASSDTVELEDVLRFLPTRAMSGDGILEVLGAHGGNVTAAARALGVPRTTLRDRIKGLRKAVASPSSEGLTRLERIS